MSRIGIQILSYNRPEYLKLTIESLLKVMSDDDKLCIIEQSDKEDNQQKCINLCQQYPNIHVIPLFKNFGQRGATNILYQSSFFDDCQYVMLSDHDNLFHDDLTVYCNCLDNYSECWISTGYNSPEHDIENKKNEWLLKSSCRAGHMVMRKSDFDKVMPIDTSVKYEEAWFAGLDWSLTHWHPNSPGHKRDQLVYCLSGAVEHFGINSTWQGTYDDEYVLDDLIWMRKNNLYNIIKKYPPKHIYLNHKYWYEKISDQEFKSKTDIEIINNIKDIEISDNIKQDYSIYAFNYMWPKYGLAFLESSIRSIINHVDKYILFLNKYSYIGEECEDKDLKYVEDIIQKFDKIEIRYNASKDHPESAKRDNIGHYSRIMTEIAKENNINYIWLVQSDEVYDDENINKIKYILNSNKDNSFIINPYCYIDNPHWVVNPIEEFKRPTIINIKNDSNNNLVNIDVGFHHLSGVLTRRELLYKYKNWGHRDDVANNLNDYFNLLDQNKINKSMKNLHPIEPSLYKSIVFVNKPINKHLMLDWFYYLLTYNNPYNNIQDLFKMADFSFPKDPRNQMLLDPIELQYLSAICLESISRESNILEYGSWNGYIALLINKINPNSTLCCIDNYDTCDQIYRNYDSQLNYIYRIAAQRILNNMNNNVHLFNGDAKFLSMFKNNSIDFAFIHPGLNLENIKNILIESRPKMKHGSILVNHHTQNTNVSSIFEDIIYNKANVKCPWGNEKFEYFEIYNDILGDVMRHKNIEINDSHNGMSFIRIKRF